MLTRNSILIVAAFAAACTATSTALAEDPPPPPGGPAIEQYVETVPSGSGGSAVGVGQSHKATLPKKVQKKLNRKATPLAPKLRSIATSSGYGAPQRALSSPTRTQRAAPSTSRAAPSRSRAAPSGGTPSRRAPARPMRRTEGERNALSAAVSAATASGSRAPLILLAVIVLLTTAAGILAAGRRSGRAR
jgi:cobalamin biosynthesis Mg chelatase CobN